MVREYLLYCCAYGNALRAALLGIDQAAQLVHGLFVDLTDARLTDTQPFSDFFQSEIFKVIKLENLGLAGLQAIEIELQQSKILAFVADIKRALVIGGDLTQVIARLGIMSLELNPGR